MCRWCIRWGDHKHKWQGKESLVLASFGLPVSYPSFRNRIPSSRSQVTAGLIEMSAPKAPAWPGGGLLLLLVPATRRDHDHVEGKKSEASLLIRICRQRCMRESKGQWVESSDRMQMQVGCQPVLYSRGIIFQGDQVTVKLASELFFAGLSWSSSK